MGDGLERRRFHSEGGRRKGKRTRGTAVVESIAIFSFAFCQSPVYSRLYTCLPLKYHSLFQSVFGTEQLQAPAELLSIEVGELEDGSSLGLPHLDETHRSPFPRIQWVYFTHKNRSTAFRRSILVYSRHHPCSDIPSRTIDCLYACMPVVV